MFRRSFLSSLGVLPFLGFVKTKDKENPNNLPVVKFKNRKIINHKELLGNKDEVLVYITEDEPLSDSFSPEVKFYGEFLMTKETTPRSIRVEMTKNTQTKCNSHIWASIKKESNYVS